MSKVGTNLAMHFVRKSLDRKLSTKIKKEFNLTKGGRAYDTVDIKDEALRFTVHLLVGCVLRK